MDPSLFCGVSQQRPREVQQLEEVLQNDCFREVILLPPDSGDQNVDSDVEDDCEMAEPAGHLEVVEESDTEETEDE